MYNLFISHSWSYSDEYDKLVNLLNNSKLQYKNYSVPKDDPIHKVHTKTELRNAIKNQIAPSSCVIILAGVYATYSEWINIEIELAKEMFKPIIAIEPFAAEKTSSVVKNNSNKIVKWNTDSIVNAIKELCN